MFPDRLSTSRNTAGWSKQLESIRKDVECTFGRLKVRWRCLKIPSRFQSEVLVGNQFRTCCAMYNMMLDFDTEGQWDLDPEFGQFDDDELSHIRLRYASHIKELRRRSGFGEAVVGINEHWDNSFVGGGAMFPAPHVGDTELPLQEDKQKEAKEWLLRRARLVTHFVLYMKSTDGVVNWVPHVAPRRRDK